MTNDQYVLWFVLMAVGIALILGLGTLVMAGVLHRPRREQPTEAKQRHLEVVERHHWYDRFHHAA